MLFPLSCLVQAACFNYLNLNSRAIDIQKMSDPFQLPLQTCSKIMK